MEKGVYFDSLKSIKEEKRVRKVARKTEKKKDKEKDEGIERKSEGEEDIEHYTRE